MTAHESKTTIDHEEVRRWAEDRDGHPARVKGTGDEDDPSEGGILRIDFGDEDEGLERISWDEFFEVFDSRNLQFLYQTETAEGEQSRFFKFIARE